MTSHATAAELATILDDLRAEGDDLDRLVAGLDDAGWDRPTPAEGWAIRHQIAHLVWADRALVLAATDEPAFADVRDRVVADPNGSIEEGAHEADGEPPASLLDRWRDGRAKVLTSLGALTPEARVPWFVGTMGTPAQGRSRIMETWAHGEDVAATLGVDRPPTARLRHVAHMGVRTLRWSFRVNGLPAPEEPVRVELTAPDGALWTWGPDDAADQVSGPALDFCLRVTQRRHRADLALVARGPVADRWLDIAQAYAGPPGPGRPPVSDGGG
jgi:uncharacterized protein (TIGR03084 family)